MRSPAYKPPRDIFCLDDGPRILDCLDFDERLRAGDVLADVAFLAMDLERLGQAELAWHLLGRHAGLLGDRWPQSLAHFHIAYRAQIRAKVDAIRSVQGVEGMATVVCQHLALAYAHLRAAQPRLVLIGGLPGTGKTTVVRALAGELGAVNLHSDEVRKALAGVDPGHDAGGALDEGLYSGEWT